MHTGYNGYAESNNIVVLYPQVKKDILKENPNACFDWWGYADRDFATKKGESGGSHPLSRFSFFSCPFLLSSPTTFRRTLTFLPKHRTQRQANGGGEEDGGPPRRQGERRTRGHGLSLLPSSKTTFGVRPRPGFS